SPLEVSDSSVVGNCRGSKKGNKRLRAGNPKSSKARHCGKHHRGECLEGLDFCLYCGQPGHKYNDIASAKRDGRRGRAQTTPPTVVSSQFICLECGRSHAG
ncbi:hypothetical protein HAX54_007007, partial [Datura stramonium]|nr:hypothetical protein [Datura stramonium]